MRIDQLDVFDLSYIDTVEFDRGIGDETGDRVLGIDLIGRISVFGKEIPECSRDNQDKQERHKRESCLHIDIVFHCVSTPRLGNVNRVACALAEQWGLQKSGDVSQDRTLRGKIVAASDHRGKRSVLFIAPGQHGALQSIGSGLWRQTPAITLNASVCASRFGVSIRLSKKDKNMGTGVLRT